MRAIGDGEPCTALAPEADVVTAELQEDQNDGGRRWEEGRLQAGPGRPEAGSFLTCPPAPLPPVYPAPDGGREGERLLPGSDFLQPA